MRKYLAIFLIALMAVSVVSAAGVVSAAPVMKPLPTPNPVSPKNNANLPDERPWTALVQWKPVESAYLKEYKVEVQYYEPGFGQWFDYTPSLLTPTTHTYYQLDFSSFASYENQFRWRVIAVSSVDSAFDSAPSSWRSFTFGTSPDTRLETPHILSPANNIDVNVGMPMTFNWDPVPGADYYLAYREKLVDGVWKPAPPTVISDDQSLPYTYTNWDGAAGTYRWHVVAWSSSGPLWSDPSSWRTFTVFE